MLFLHQICRMVEDSRPLIIITARIGSSRLPGKVLRPFWKDYSLLEFLIRRLQARPETSRRTLATIDNSENDAVAALGTSLGVKVVRGPEDNVVARMKMCLQDEDVHYVARVTADNPFTDPELFVLQLNEMIRIGADYSYCHETPKGTAADIWTMDCFKETVAKASTKYELEHANAWVWDHPDCYKMLWFVPPKPYAGPELNLSIDTENDFIRVCTYADRFANPLVADISSINLVVGID